MSQLPTYDRLLQALRELGGSGSTDEIYQRVAENLKLPEDVLSVAHDPETSNQTEVQYRLAWARTYLKKFGFLESPQRGLWSLTKKAESALARFEIFEERGRSRIKVYLSRPELFRGMLLRKPRAMALLQSISLMGICLQTN